MTKLLNIDTIKPGSQYTNSPQNQETHLQLALNQFNPGGFVRPNLRPTSSKGSCKLHGPYSLPSIGHIATSLPQNPKHFSQAAAACLESV